MYLGDKMNYDFTKSFIKGQNIKQDETMNKMNELNRLKRINDNMNGINPFTKEKLSKSEIKEDIVEQDNLANKIEALRNIKKD